MRLNSTASAISIDLGIGDHELPVVETVPVTSSDVQDDPFDTSSAVEVSVRVPALSQPSDHEQISPSIEAEHFEILQNWEGIVTTFGDDTFFAAMRPQDSGSHRAVDEMEIDIDNVPEGDRCLIREGGVFYLTLGIRRPRGERPQKTIRVVFRRMPRWSNRDVERVEIQSGELWAKLNAGLIAQQNSARHEDQ